jgi:hypothetical protein
LVELDFVNKQTGETRTERVPYSVGPFVYAGTPHGLLVRHSTPGGTAVLNAGNGAFLSSALLYEGSSR